MAYRPITFLLSDQRGDGVGAWVLNVPLSYASTCSDSGVARICKRGAKATERGEGLCVGEGGGGVPLPPR